MTSIRIKVNIMHSNTHVLYTQNGHFERKTKFYINEKSRMAFLDICFTFEKFLLRKASSKLLSSCADLLAV